MEERRDEAGGGGQGDTPSMANEDSPLAADCKAAGWIGDGPLVSRMKELMKHELESAIAAAESFDYRYAGAVTGWHDLDSEGVVDPKVVRYEKGPADGMTQKLQVISSDGLVCFFSHTNGQPVQSVYRIVLREVERSAEELKEHVSPSWEWVAEYVGRRRHLPPMQVNGVRKGV